MGLMLKQLFLLGTSLPPPFVAFSEYLEGFLIPAIHNISHVKFQNNDLFSLSLDETLIEICILALTSKQVPPKELWFAILSELSNVNLLSNYSNKI